MLRQVASPDDTVVCAPAACRQCGAGLVGARATGVQLQEFDITSPPPPRVTEYQVQARACGRCGAVTAGQPPPGITARAQYGPEAHAQAANLASVHYIPVARAAQLMGDAGWMAGVRHKAAGRLEPFIYWVRVLLREAGVLYADETPAPPGTWDMSTSPAPGTMPGPGRQLIKAGDQPVAGPGPIRGFPSTPSRRSRPAAAATPPPRQARACRA
jgi:zinc-finger binding domain of transposase IS66/Transposase IS66 family